MILIQEGSRALERVLWGDDKPHLVQVSVLKHKIGDDEMAVVNGVKGAKVQPDLHWISSSIKIFSASSRRRLRLYPETVIEIGSPSGATCSTLTNSPGTQPISINFRKRSLFSNEWMRAMVPGPNSDNRFIFFDWFVKMAKFLCRRTSCLYLGAVKL